MLAAAALDTMEEANFIFHKYDQNKDGQIDEDELALCLQGLQVRINGRQRKTEEEVRDWVRKELKRNDTDGDGQLSFDEFVEYYNSLMDRLQQGAVQDALEVEAKKVQAKHNAADDETTFAGLHMLAAILSNSSVASYAGINLPFTRLQAVDVTKSGYACPKPECGVSSRGLILDLSRGAQRIITPWGSLPLGYQLVFPGINANENVELPEGSIEPTPPGKG